MATPGTSQPVVEAVGLTKVFRDFWMRTRALAVDHVDLEINRDEIFGLLGPNGSGKSTIIKMILGLLHRSSGRLLVFGRNPSDVAIKSRIGFLPEESYLYRFLNPRETLDYYGKLFGLDRRTRRRRTDELLDMVGLTAVQYRPIGEFSKGMTRRIGLAQALINDPEFLILDEPTSGLDPIGTRQVKDLIVELGRRGKTILLSSHLLADVEDVCDRMVMLYGGKIRAQGTANELLADTQRTIIETPRLSDETISRVEQVIQQAEGKAIERVQAPRQRLENLFIDMVEKAREEQVATSGAISAGSTAAFLRADEAQGDQLIESLTSEAPEAAPVKAREMTAVDHDRPAADERAELLDELTSDGPARDEPIRRPMKEAAPPPAAPDDVDRSLIDSLLDEPPEQDKN